MGTKRSPFQQNLRKSNIRKVEVINLGLLVRILFILILDHGMDVDLQSKYTHMYKVGIHICENLAFQIWSL